MGKFAIHKTIPSAQVALALTFWEVSMKAHHFKILIISDHLDNANYFVHTIQFALHGTQVYIAQGLLQSVEIAKSKEPDVILIDSSQIMRRV